MDVTVDITRFLVHAEDHTGNTVAIEVLGQALGASGSWRFALTEDKPYDEWSSHRRVFQFDSQEEALAGARRVVEAVVEARRLRASAYDLLTEAVKS